eukprot:g30053.t1
MLGVPEDELGNRYLFCTCGLLARICIETANSSLQRHVLWAYSGRAHRLEYGWDSHQSWLGGVSALPKSEPICCGDSIIKAWAGLGWCSP